VCADLLENRSGQARLAARNGHALNAAAPLLDEAEFMKNTPNHAVPEFGHTLLNVLDRQPERQNSRILDFNAVIENGHSDWRAALGIVGVDNGVDDRLA